MKRCEKGHYYNELETAVCPYCDESGGEKLSTDYEGKCGNCHKWLNEEDLYCRYCGTKRGEGYFDPYENFMQCVYGSPVTSTYRCKKCGLIYTSSGMIGSNQGFCYKCGGELICMKRIDALDGRVLFSENDSDLVENNGYDTSDTYDGFVRVDGFDDAKTIEFSGQGIQGEKNVIGTGISRAGYVTSTFGPGIPAEHKRQKRDRGFLLLLLLLGILIFLALFASLLICLK